MLTSSSMPGGEMGFGEAIGTCFRKYAVFQGRARRSEYWYFVLFQSLVSTSVRILTAAVPAPATVGLALLAFAIFFLPSLSVTIRRLHDTNNSGWWVLAIFVFVSAALAAFVAVHDGALNQYGIVVDQIPFFVCVSLALFAILMVYIVTLARRGNPEANDYGPDPLSDGEEMIEPIFS